MAGFSPRTISNVYYLLETLMDFLICRLGRTALVRYLKETTDFNPKMPSVT